MRRVKYKPRIGSSKELAGTAGRGGRGRGRGGGAGGRLEGKGVQEESGNPESEKANNARAGSGSETETERAAQERAGAQAGHSPSLAEGRVQQGDTGGREGEEEEGGGGGGSSEVEEEKSKDKTLSTSEGKTVGVKGSLSRRPVSLKGTITGGRLLRKRVAPKVTPGRTQRNTQRVSQTEPEAVGSSTGAPDGRPPGTETGKTSSREALEDSVSRQRTRKLSDCAALSSPEAKEGERNEPGASARPVRRRRVSSSSSSLRGTASDEVVSPPTEQVLTNEKATEKPSLSASGLPAVSESATIGLVPSSSGEVAAQSEHGSGHNPKETDNDAARGCSDSGEHVAISECSSLIVGQGQVEGGGGGSDDDSSNGDDVAGRTPSTSCDLRDSTETPSPAPKRKASTKRKGSTVAMDASPPSKRSRSSTPRLGKVREAPDRSTMTMQELIYYNPSANPMKSTVEERLRKQQEKERGEGGGGGGEGEDFRTNSPPHSRERSLSHDGGGGGEEVEQDERIVPQLRIGADGSIVIDEQSMVVETTKQQSLADTSDVVYEVQGYTTSNSFRRMYRVTKWTREETSKFFKALSQVGTDFTMMTLLLPKRSRKELKNKFKKEEKSNPHLVSQALKSQITYQKLHQP